MPSEKPESKGDHTRRRIRTAALRSFRNQGYDATTIRKIAEELDLSVGATNYHFPSKNQLIQELYLDVQQAHREAAMLMLAQETRLAERLRVVFSTGLEQLAPYHDHAGEFLSAAVSPRSPINPLATESAEALAIVQDLFTEAIGKATAPGLPDDIRSLLPRAMVLAYLLLALFWVYDSTEGQQRTRRLLDRGLKLVGTALPLTRLPLLHRVVRDLLRLVTEVGA